MAGPCSRCGGALLVWETDGLAHCLRPATLGGCRGWWIRLAGAWGQVRALPACCTALPLRRAA